MRVSQGVWSDLKSVKQFVQNVFQLLVQFLIIVWIWTGGLILLGLLWLFFKTKEFLLIKVLKRE